AASFGGGGLNGTGGVSSPFLCIYSFRKRSTPSGPRLRRTSAGGGNPLRIHSGVYGRSGSIENASYPLGGCSGVLGQPSVWYGRSQYTNTWMRIGRLVSAP